MTKILTTIKLDHSNEYPLVYVVIPNLNGMAHLPYSLLYLFKSNYKNYRVVLVDNGSTDDSLNYVAREYKDILILENKGKRGFAGGVNTGIRHALASGADYIGVFSNDIKVHSKWIDFILPEFNKDQDAGLVGFTEITRDKENMFFGSKVDINNITSQSVKGLAGCLFICSAKAFKEVGLFDEDYYMYGEDNDLFYRFVKNGFKLVETNVPVWHYGEGSFNNNKLMPVWLAYRNALRFSIKNENFWRIMRMMLSLANQGCNPFLRRAIEDPNLRRLRRYNPVVNLFIIFGSFIWNIYNIRSTLRARSLKYEFQTQK
jgi:GT2 family glycosyltransferase